MQFKEYIKKYWLFFIIITQPVLDIIAYFTFNEKITIISFAVRSFYLLFIIIYTFLKSKDRKKYILYMLPFVIFSMLHVLNSYRLNGLEIFDDIRYLISVMQFPIITICLIDYLKDEDYETYSTKLNDCYYNLEEINNALKDSLNALNEYEYTPEYIAERIYNIKKVMRKHGNSEDDIFTAHEQLLKDITLMSDYEYALNKQKELVNNLKKDLMIKANALSILRNKYANKLNKEVDAQLSDLSLNNAHFKVHFNIIEPRSNGIDDVTFYISSNVGMPFNHLKDVVSGGESSRIMLGLKVIFSKYCNYETMILDEIDSGVSGKVASSVGRKIHEIGKSRQVIVISHIPQVASYADHAYEVRKVVENNATKTQIKELDEQGFIVNIAKLLTDSNVNEQAINLANELVSNSRK